MFTNLVTKRAYAYEGATVEWIDGNIGSKFNNEISWSLSYG